MPETISPEANLSPEFNSVSYSAVSYEELTSVQQSQYVQEFRTLLEPLYGSQDSAIERIKSAKDRCAEVVLDKQGKPCATLVYKTELVSETHWNMRNGDTVTTQDAFEVKTLALFNPDQDGANGIGSWLLKRAEVLARAAQAKRNSLNGYR